MGKNPITEWSIYGYQRSSVEVCKKGWNTVCKYINKSNIYQGIQNKILIKSTEQKYCGYNPHISKILRTTFWGWDDGGNYDIFQNLSKLVEDTHCHLVFYMYCWFFMIVGILCGSYSSRNFCEYVF